LELAFFLEPFVLDLYLDGQILKKVDNFVLFSYLAGKIMLTLKLGELLENLKPLKGERAWKFLHKKC